MHKCQSAPRERLFQEESEEIRPFLCAEWCTSLSRSLLNSCFDRGMVESPANRGAERCRSSSRGFENSCFQIVDWRL